MGARATLSDGESLCVLCERESVCVSVVCVFWRERKTKKGGKMGDDCKLRNFIYNLIPLNLFYIKLIIDVFLSVLFYFLFFLIVLVYLYFP